MRARSPGLSSSLDPSTKIVPVAVPAIAMRSPMSAKSANLSIGATSRSVHVRVVSAPQLDASELSSRSASAPNIANAITPAAPTPYATSGTTDKPPEPARSSACTGAGGAPSPAFVSDRGVGSSPAGSREAPVPVLVLVLVLAVEALASATRARRFRRRTSSVARSGISPPSAR